LSRRGEQSRTRGGKLRSTRTKAARTRVSRKRSDLEQQLEICRRELAEARKHLAEALEQQARTRELSDSGEVLNVISRSPTELQSVLDAIVNTAARMCTAEYSYIAKYEHNVLRYVAHVRVSDECLRFLADPIRVEGGAVIGRVVLEKRTVHVPDVLAEPEFDRLEWQKVGKQRTVLGAPLRRKGTLIGVIILARTSVAPFTNRQIELVTTFANEAVIAIENARLFDEVQARTRGLSEAVEQIATSEVLRVISASPGELEPVFQAILENAVGICEAKSGNLFLYEGNSFRIVAMQNAPPWLTIP
jgi:GAF domain-containing protein